MVMKHKECMCGLSEEMHQRNDRMNLIINVCNSLGIEVPALSISWAVGITEKMMIDMTPQELIEVTVIRLHDLNVAMIEIANKLESGDA
jgi:hypothetical protein